MALARNGDPYVDDDGKLLEALDIPEADTMILHENRKVLPVFHSLVVTKKISADNMPEPDHQQQTVVSAIVGMKLLGLADSDIAEIMNTSLDNLQSIVKTPAAQVTFEKIYQNIIHAGAENVQGRIASHANDAVGVVVDLMHNEEVRDDVRLKASQDILDRSGTNPDQFFADSVVDNQTDDELRITIMDETGETERVKVDIKRKS